ncbi:MAG: glycosyl transferase family 2 [Bacteroidetes bacterium]|nr:MAG: glycosyl transferase family 2 [Bacteroidota bacterium]
MYFQVVEIQLSVIIVNYNVKYFLEQCLHSVCKASKNFTVEIIVVDNNSTDRSREYLEPHFPNLQFIWNPNNDGFARACNLGLKKARGKFILFLNPDTILPENCFEECIGFFNMHPEAGAIGVRMLDGSGLFLKESKRGFPSPSTSFYKLMGLARAFPNSKKFAKYHLGNLSQFENHEVDVLAGAFMMVRKTVLDKTGTFDEKFFMYGEDIDLSYRIKEAGFKNYYISTISILHFKGESTKKGSLNYVRMFYRAMSIFVQKHYGKGKAGIFSLIIQVSIAVRAAMAGFGKFVRWIGLPILDAALILLSFYLMKIIWGDYFLQHESYNNSMLRIAFPSFTLLFLIAAYYAGLYDRPFSYSKLARACLVSTIILLAGYSLLPERYRFSRAIILLTPVLAFIFMIVLRWLLIQWKLIDKVDEQSEYRRTLIIGSEAEFGEAQLIMKDAELANRVLGSISPNGSDISALGKIEDLKIILKKMPIREIIFCEGQLSYSTIIEHMQHLPQGIRSRIHSKGTHSIVGSDFKNSSGEIISMERKFRLAQPGPRRVKRLFDCSLSLIFILSFPLHFILQKNTGRFWSQVFQVLWAKKTWVGYGTKAPGLPQLRAGVIACNGLNGTTHNLAEDGLYRLDYAYARDYSASYDLGLIWKSYKNLGSQNRES